MLIVFFFNFNYFSRARFCSWRFERQPLVWVKETLRWKADTRKCQQLRLAAAVNQLVIYSWTRFSILEPQNVLTHPRKTKHIGFCRTALNNSIIRIHLETGDYGNAYRYMILKGTVHTNAFSKRSFFIANVSKAPRPHYRFRSVFPVHTKTPENATTVICACERRCEWRQRFRKPPFSPSTLIR